MARHLHARAGPRLDFVALHGLREVSMDMGKVALVTVASGHLGRNRVPALAQRGYRASTPSARSRSACRSAGSSSPMARRTSTPRWRHVPSSALRIDGMS